MTISLDKNNMSNPNDIMGMKENTFCMLLHLSQLLMFCVPPGAGIAAPIVLWAITKDKNAAANQHGKMIINWLITWFIAMFACGVLIAAGIGLLLLPVFITCGIVFPIMGAVKANNGIFWDYRIGNFKCYYPFIK